MPKHFIVTARCRATLTEEWVLTVPDDFDGDPADAFDDPHSYGATLDFREEESSDEADRVIVNVEPISEELAGTA